MGVFTPFTSPSIWVPLCTQCVAVRQPEEVGVLIARKIAKGKISWSERERI
jgi:hypothetical protein